MSSQSAIRIVPPIDPKETAEAPRRETTTWVRRRSPRAESPTSEIASSRACANASATVAGKVVQALVDRGLTTFFGIPGGPIAPLFEALRHNERAELVEVRHESHAAFAAASYFRLTGRVAAAVVTAGPGVTNAVTGVASAATEATPLLVISGDVAWSSHGGRLLQNCGPEGLDIEKMFAPITRAQVRVTNGRSGASQALAAFEAATNPMKMGPSLLVLPMDKANERAPEMSAPPARRRTYLGPAAGTVERTARLLAEAERPLVVLGGGCWTNRETVRALLDVLNVPFVTTPRAKGLISEAHPKSLRNGGMAASRWATHYTQKGVDVALVLGTDLDDVSVGPTPYVKEGGQLIHVDYSPEVFNRNLPTSLGITADVGAFCEELYEFSLETGLIQPRGRALVKASRVTSPHEREGHERDRRTPIPPDTAVANLQAALPHARFVTDIGEHMLFALHYLKAEAPGDFNIQIGLGSMGSGIAGATGLSLADRSRPIVCICGDGGMQMSGMEILTAKKLELPIVYAVFNDSRYNMVHHGMKQLYGEAEPYDVPDVDFCAWASAMGVPSMTIRRGGEISPNLMHTLLAGGGPALLDIRIDRELRIKGGGRVESLQRMSVSGPEEARA